ncbi:uncharacterized protein DFL_003813 [Arthrobotrys flagrans]|uniref:Uncharacterized protein n=1 Tax=Arthrobotrys flagrans TaxID=97331 RepID=A0A437A2X3_ARTFL|nr:hypothetical protein DFL_003813 [Arthrobotrys flagrans]
MCVIKYRFEGCRRIGPEGDHVYVVFKHTCSNWDDPRCNYFQTHQIFSRKFPCPLCLHQILFRLQLEQDRLEKAPPGTKVELNYRKCPVFYDTNNPKGEMPPGEADKKRALAQERRKQRIVAFEAAGILDAGGSIPLDDLENVMNGLQTLAITQESEKATRVPHIDT